MLLKKSKDVAKTCKYVSKWFRIFLQLNIFIWSHGRRKDVYTDLEI